MERKKLPIVVADQCRWVSALGKEALEVRLRIFDPETLRILGTRTTILQLTELKPVPPDLSEG